MFGVVVFWGLSSVQTASRRREFFAMPMEVNSVDVVDGAVGPMASFSSIVKVEKCCLTRGVGRCDSRDLWWRGLEPYHLPIPGPTLDCQTWVVPIDWTLAFF